MAESTSVHPTAVGMVGQPVLYRTPETELLKQWQHARDTLTTSEMFEASAYDELLIAARNVEADPDRLWRAIEHHTKLAERIARDRSTEDGMRIRVRRALLHTVEQTYLRQDEEALVAEENAYEEQITRDIAARLAVEGW
jgi:hypothetical protein